MTRRDWRICNLYRSKGSMRVVAQIMKLSRGRIHQILAEHHVRRVVLEQNPRSVFLGITVTPIMKRRLRAKSRQTGKSVSLIAATAIAKGLGWR